jgi:hypothetical protein
MLVLLGKLRRKRAGWRAKTGRFFTPSDEQTEISEEQNMLKRAKATIDRLRNKWFPAGDDKVWKQWVDFKRREARDLVELLTSDVRDSFKRRAIFLLIVPSAELNVIYWKEAVGKFYHRQDFLNVLTSDLLIYTADLVVEFCTMLKPLHCDRPKHLVEGGGGITVHMSVPDKYHDALYFYNSCILLLLKLLPDEDRERIFPLFSLRDISTYCGMEDASGYNPFRELLYSEVDEKWKRQADATIRQIVGDELAGRAKPREEWENALQCYADVINLQLYGESLRYSVELYADQIQFLASEEHYGHGRLIDDWNVVRIFQILSGDVYREIRRQVARFVVFGNKDEFRVWSGETLQTANMMLEEFGKDDEELAQRIQSAIGESKKQSAENQNKKSEAQKAEDDMMSQMR